jgi:excisionase family DNA binding protein
MTKGRVYPQVYTVVEFSQLFKLSAEAVRKLIRKGEIPAIRIGKQYRIPQDVVDRYFAQATSPEARGFGMWKEQPVDSLRYVNALRDQDHRTAEELLHELAEEA